MTRSRLRLYRHTGAGMLRAAVNRRLLSFRVAQARQPH